jgi:hypothetical protein
MRCYFENSNWDKERIFQDLVVSFISFDGSEWIQSKLHAELKSAISIISDESKNTNQKAGSRHDKCSICLCDFTDKKILSKARGHSFCAGCIDEAIKHQKKCPVCSQVYGPLMPCQPPGEMIDGYQSKPLLGFKT